MGQGAAAVVAEASAQHILQGTRGTNHDLLYRQRGLEPAPIAKTSSARVLFRAVVASYPSSNSVCVGTGYSNPAAGTTGQGILAGGTV